MGPGQADLDGVEPFRLAAERPPGKSADLGGVTLVVAGARRASLRPPRLLRRRR